MVREMDFVDECYADKDLSLLKKLTLVIPTYNRNYYLSRCLWYHAHFPFGQIIVADSSPEEKKVVNRETVAKVRETFGADILYLEYEPEMEKYGGDIYRKWGDAVMHVGTAYSQICTDKEFVIPTSLVKCSYFLQNHPEYEFSDGCIYNIINSAGEYKLKERYPHRNPPKSNNPIKRFFISTTQTPVWNNTLLFSLYRAETMKEVYSTLWDYDINDIRYGELALGYFGHFLGMDNYEKTMCFKCRDEINIDVQRKEINASHSSESSSSRYILMDRYDSDDFTRKTSENFMRCIRDNINASNDDNSKYLDSLLFNTKTWIRYNGEKGMKYSKIWYQSKIIRKIYNHLPQMVASIINKTAFKIFGYSIPAQEISPFASKEIETILQCIYDTQEFQNQDKTII